MVKILIVWVLALAPMIFIQPAQTPWPTCVKPGPIRCDPFKDQFVTTTTWHDRSPPKAYFLVSDLGKRVLY